MPISNQLELNLICDRLGRSVVHRQYATYPFRLSRTFRLDVVDSHRAFLYILNTSPGLFAGDNLRISLQMGKNTSLYLSDPAATKVHTMPTDATAKVLYRIEVGAEASLEFVPEPLILFPNAALEQTTQIKLHPGGRLFMSEIVLPGRLARGELYHFRHYFSRLQVTTTAGNPLFTDAMRLQGSLNPFSQSPLSALTGAIASLFIVLPDNLSLLRTKLEDLDAVGRLEMMVGTSPLPQGNGLFVRAVARQSQTLKTYVKYALNCVRYLSGQLLPESK